MQRDVPWVIGQVQRLGEGAVRVVKIKWQKYMSVTVRWPRLICRLQPIQGITRPSDLRLQLRKQRVDQWTNRKLCPMQSNNLQNPWGQKVEVPSPVKRSDLFQDNLIKHVIHLCRRTWPNSSSRTVNCTRISARFSTSNNNITLSKTRIRVWRYPLRTHQESMIGTWTMTPTSIRTQAHPRTP